MQSSPFFLAILTRSLRRSSVRDGIGMRMKSPSACGLSPRFASTIAFSMAFACPFSQGLTVSIRASGTATVAICAMGVGTP